MEYPPVFEKHDETNSTCGVDDDIDDIDIDDIYDDDSNIPSQFICPLTLQIMVDPLVSRYGQSYERSAIMEWIGNGNTSCPLTRHPLRLSDLISNHTLQQQITTWLQQEHNQSKLQVYHNKLVVQQRNSNNTERILGMYMDVPSNETATATNSNNNISLSLEWQRNDSDSDSDHEQRRQIMEQYHQYRLSRLQQQQPQPSETTTTTSHQNPNDTNHRRRTGSSNIFSRFRWRNRSNTTTTIQTQR